MNKTFILGPCAAETREQVLETARSLSAQWPNKASAINYIFRAGIWKPRTSPETFQGVGEAGLPWLKEVQETYQVPVAAEVATPEHVKAIHDSLYSQHSTTLNTQHSTTLNSQLSTLNYYIWIGARTSANPIAVQAITDALSALTNSTAKLPQAVLIKNPVNEDVNLWIGNIERLQATGLPVMAVHRGCNHRPCWAMAFELRRRMPHVPMLLDPSHMSGDADQVPSLCQLAMDLDYDGLMIEVHCDPKHALSDAKQQLTPAQAIDVISGLQYRTAGSQSGLLELRQQIDEVDDEIWALIARRVAIARQIGDYKREHKMPVLQAKRYDEILQRRLEWAKKNGVSVDAVQSILETLHNECISVQL